MSRKKTTDSNMRNQLNRLIDTSSAALNQAVEKGQGYFAGAKEQASRANAQYQNSQAREYVDALMKRTGDGLDTISGKAMYELVRERLDLQDQYNDLLATKLQEALDRIGQLEARMADPKFEAGDDDN